MTGRWGAIVGLIAAAIPLVLAYGFSVDDALITARVAHHIANGAGSRFNLDASVVDTVTPLGFAHALAPLAKSGPLAAFAFARILGALAWLVTGAYVGHAIGKLDGKVERFLPLLVVTASLPLGAWASSGMETGIVTLLATLGTARFRFAPILAGLAAAWRPELLPWAMVLGVGTSLSEKRRPEPALVALTLVLGPALVVAIVRQLAFGSAMPLAVLAKPSSWNDGLRYGLGALGLSALPILVLAPKVLRELPGRERVLVLAGFVHFVAIVLAGGDWMPLIRLAVPVLPSFALVAASIASRSGRTWTLCRVVGALTVSVFLWKGQFVSSRGVWAARLALIDSARPMFADATRVATLDAGWVGVAFPGHVVDVAGVTDPEVARLPGGHTSKLLPPDFLERQRVDVVVALTRQRAFFRVNDQRLARQAEEQGFVRSGELPIPGTEFRYLVLKRPR